MIPLPQIPESADEDVKQWWRDVKSILETEMRRLNQQAVRRSGRFEFPRATVAELQATPPIIRPNVAGVGVYVTDETGGEVFAMSDSAGNFRRQTDRAIIS